MSRRLIDADALKYEPLPKGERNYRTYNLDDAYEDGYHDAFVDVMNAPTIDAEPHWIPCSERFPEKDGYYLTTTCYRQVYCDFWNEDHFDRTEAVIAWMPLPEPYEVEE